MEGEKVSDDEMVHDLQMLPEDGKLVYNCNFNYYLKLYYNICN